MAYIGASPTTSAFVTDTFNGNGSTVAFTMSVAPANTTSIIVAVSGVLQDPSTYSVSGTTLTFSAAPPAGTGNISVRFLGIPASGVTNTAYRTQTEFTATAGQTTFSVPSYTVGYIDVYRNGALLGSADFTATNGTTVVLAAGASAGDLVETVSFYVSSVLNAIPATNGAVTSAYLLDGSVTSAKFANLTTLPTSGGNITLPSVTGTAMVSGNMPAFSAYANSGTTIANASFTKVLFDTENFDTNNNFASSRFTPTVAGYYQISAGVSQAGTLTGNNNVLGIHKNGTWSVVGSTAGGSSNNGYWSVSGLLYMNGSTDYVEIYLYQNSGGTITTNTGVQTVFTGCLVRSA
jgi:hypothetical protein